AAAVAAQRRHASSTPPLGFIGLGKIGSGMVINLIKGGESLIVFDPSSAAAKAVEGEAAKAVASIAEVAHDARVVFSALPDDNVLQAVSSELLPKLAARGDRPIHVSCSTVSPSISRALSEAHAEKEVGFVSAPVFARPDGMRRGEATFPVSGPDWAKETVVPLLKKTALGVHDFGEDAGAANVVKLGGNFLIAAAIQSMAEASALAESYDVDREKFISLMSSTIFDCLIYKGYGHRVAARDHHPYPDAHFALDLGSKDVSLVHSAAAQARCPMPVASLLRDRFVASQNSGRGKLDWSAVALKASEEAGSKQVAEAITRLENGRSS
ncbi:yfjR, partial [Symbiodinium pilosum]